MLRVFKDLDAERVRIDKKLSILSFVWYVIPAPYSLRGKLRRESRTKVETGFLLEFIPMEIGAGMTKKTIVLKEPPLPCKVSDEA